MATKKLVTVQTKWQGLWGEKVKAVDGTIYDCSKEGEMDVSEDHAREFCSSVGWRMKPVRQPPGASEPPKVPAPPSGKPKAPTTRTPPQAPSAPPPPAPDPKASEPAPEDPKGDDGEAGFIG